jgi:hypothetical protein
MVREGSGKELPETQRGGKGGLESWVLVKMT